MSFTTIDEANADRYRRWVPSGQTLVRIDYTHKNFIGRPDPSGFGKASFFTTSGSLGERLEEFTTKRGVRVDKVTHVPNPAAEGGEGESRP